MISDSEKKIADKLLKIITDVLKEDGMEKANILLVCLASGTATLLEFAKKQSFIAEFTDDLSFIVQLVPTELLKQTQSVIKKPPVH